MCGVVGFVTRDNAIADLGETVERMACAVVHRGPDAAGHWIDKEAGVALGHRRLAVIELSIAGAQPMVARSGRYVLSFNGEIYNHLELRGMLAAEGEAVEWRGHSDTETLLASIDRWGLEATLKRAVGMFAIALWDRSDRSLSLALDRLGEKPLYYGWSGNNFLFGSELSALRTFPGFAAAIDRKALALYLSQRCVPAPYSIFEGIAKLQPGHIARLEDRSRNVSVEAYWRLADAAMGPAFAGTPAEAVDELERRLSAAIRGQLMSDVPLGAFLSGGVDSSTIVSLMQASTGHQIRTFTIGFEETEHNEAPFAAEVARRLGTEHTELTVTAQDAMDIVPRLPAIWSEPFADSSQIPTAILAFLTRKYVTVALSGDGGDELFCGYSRHIAGQRLERVPVKPMLAEVLREVPPAVTARLMAMAGRSQRSRPSAERQIGLIDALAAGSPLDRYRAMQFRPTITRGLLEDGPDTAVFEAVPKGLDYLTSVSFADSVSYLPDDILVKVDRAAMAASLETRVPFLDHRVVELAFSLPSAYKIRAGQAKWPVRQILQRYIPRHIIDRQKKGFEVPLADWLRGQLRPWAENLIHSPNHDALLNQSEVERIWQEHVSSARNWATTLWTILMYRAWLLQSPSYNCA